MELLGYSDSVCCLALAAPNFGGSLCGGGSTGELLVHTIGVSSARAMAPLLSITHAHTMPVSVVAWHPHSSSIVLSGGADAAIRLWDTRATGARIVSYRELGAPVTCAAFSPDGRWAAAGTADGVAVVLDLTAGKVLSRLVVDSVRSTTPNAVTSVAFHPGARVLAAATTTCELKLWSIDAASPGKLIGSLVGSDSEIEPPPRTTVARNCQLRFAARATDAGDSGTSATQLTTPLVVVKDGARRPQRSQPLTARLWFHRNEMTSVPTRDDVVMGNSDLSSTVWSIFPPLAAASAAMQGGDAAAAAGGIATAERAILLDAVVCSTYAGRTSESLGQFDADTRQSRPLRYGRSDGRRGRGGADGGAISSGDEDDRNSMSDVDVGVVTAVAVNHGVAVLQTRIEYSRPSSTCDDRRNAHRGIDDTDTDSVSSSTSVEAYVIRRPGASLAPSRAEQTPPQHSYTDDGVHQLGSTLERPAVVRVDLYGGSSVQEHIVHNRVDYDNGIIGGLDAPKLSGSGIRSNAKPLRRSESMQSVPSTSPPQSSTTIPVKLAVSSSTQAVRDMMRQAPTSPSLSEIADVLLRQHGHELSGVRNMKRITRAAPIAAPDDLTLNHSALDAGGSWLVTKATHDMSPTRTVSMAAQNGVGKSGITLDPAVLRMSSTAEVDDAAAARCSPVVSATTALNAARVATAIIEGHESIARILHARCAASSLRDGPVDDPIH